MYELFTLGGGTYLVDLLNAVAAITSGGAYVTLAQLAGVAGLAWVLFRTAFGGSWKDNAKWMMLFVVVWGAMIVPKATVRVVDRLDPALAPAVVANVPIGLALFASLTSQVGDGLTRLTEQAFTLPDDLAYQRHGLIFGARARGRRDAPRNHRHGVREEPPQLCKAMRVPCPAARAHLGRRSQGVDRHLGAGDRRGHAVGRGLARAHVRVRDPAAGRRHRGDAGDARDRHLPGRRRPAGCAMGRRDREGRARCSGAACSRACAPTRSPARSSWPHSRQRMTS